MTYFRYHPRSNRCQDKNKFQIAMELCFPIFLKKDKERKEAQNFWRMDYANHLWRHRTVKLFACITSATWIFFSVSWKWKGKKTGTGRRIAFGFVGGFWNEFFIFFCGFSSSKKITFPSQHLPTSQSINFTSVLFLIHMKILPDPIFKTSYQGNVGFTSWHERKRICHLISLIVEAPA